MADNNNHLLILAGGTAHHLDTLGTNDMPEQFADMLGCGHTMLQLTLSRFADVVPPENVWVCVTEQYADVVAAQLPQVSPSHILREPCRRGTGLCVVYASWHIKRLHPHANMVVAPCDHLIEQPHEFARVIGSALRYVSESDAIVTIGAKPLYAEPRYGYIQADLSYPAARNHEIFRVDSFCEKPGLQRAEQLVKLPNCFWNTGIFVWKVTTIINAFRVYQPDLSDIFEQMLPHYGTPREAELIRQVYPQCETTSIDRAILEYAEEIFVFPAQFGWSDVGSWQSYRRTLPTDANGNSCQGLQIETHHTTNCIIRSHLLKRIVVKGLDGFVVTERNGELLICPIPQEGAE